jgi:Mor family transcriptional regulator
MTVNKDLIIGEAAKAKKAREERDNAIYQEYERAVAAGSMRTDVTRSLMRKYGIKSAGTIYEIRKRVQTRINNQQA